MKTTYTLLISFVCALNFLNAQLDQTSRYNPREAPYSNLQRYGLDYLLIDYTFVDGDSSIIELLDLDYLEQFRQNDVDVIHIDPISGQKVKLYAARKKYTQN